jgi:hypothetical protein
MRALARRLRKLDRTPEMELIARSVRSREPDGAHMIDLVRASLLLRTQASRKIEKYSVEANLWRLTP